MSPVAELDAPTEDRQLVSQPDTSALFMATRSGLRLVKRPIRVRRDAEGLAIEQIPGQTVQFQEGVLRVPLDPKGKVTLVDGETAPAGEILEWLEQHRLNGDWLEGFWRVDPTAPPPSKVELETLQSLALELDAEGLRSFVAQEEAGWKREQLLSVATGTLERVDAKLAEVQERIDAARAEGEASAAKKATS